jgi:hypothetical protein
MTISKAVRILLTVAVFLGLEGTFRAAPFDSDSPPAVVLTGVLKSRTEWGPPGFGETPKVDSKTVIFVLRLRKPQPPKQLSLPEGKKKLEETISEIQLWCDSAAFSGCESLLKKSVGHRITVAGQAAWAVEPTDYLPVTFHVRLITNQ